MEAAIEQFGMNEPLSGRTGHSPEGGRCDKRRLAFAVLLSLAAHLAAGPLLDAALPPHAAADQAQVPRPVPLRLNLPRTHDLPADPPVVTTQTPSAGSLETAFSPMEEGVAAPPAPEDGDRNAAVGEESPQAAIEAIYFEGAQLSQRAKLVRDIPNRPALARLAGQGKVVLVLFIGESGQVDRVEVEASEVPETLAGEVAQEFREVLFQPARIDGNAVKSRMRIEVSIKPL